MPIFPNQYRVLLLSEREHHSCFNVASIRKLRRRFIIKDILIMSSCIVLVHHCHSFITKIGKQEELCSLNNDVSAQREDCSDESRLHPPSPRRDQGHLPQSQQEVARNWLCRRNHSSGICGLSGRELGVSCLLPFRVRRCEGHVLLFRRQILVLSRLWWSTGNV